MVVVEFTNYAITWWDQLVTNRRRNYKEQVETWLELKALMRKRFVPAHYYRDLHQKLRTLRQGSLSVEDYYQEMEVAMIRANVVEDREATLTRFLNGLNREIALVVELQPYVEMEDLLHLAIKVEKQLKRKGPVKMTTSQPTSTWKSTWKSDSKPKTESNKSKEESTSKAKHIAEPTSSRNWEVKCFKCLGIGHIASQYPNKRTMVLHESGEVVTESEKEDSTDEEEIEYPIQGDLFVARRALSTQVKDDDVE